MHSQDWTLCQYFSTGVKIRNYILDKKRLVHILPKFFFLIKCIFLCWNSVSFFLRIALILVCSRYNMVNRPINCSLNSDVFEFSKKLMILFSNSMPLLETLFIIYSSVTYATLWFWKCALFSDDFCLLKIQIMHMQ